MNLAIILTIFALGLCFGVLIGLLVSMLLERWSKQIANRIMRKFYKDWESR